MGRLVFVLHTLLVLEMVEALRRRRQTCGRSCRLRWWVVDFGNCWLDDAEALV